MLILPRVALSSIRNMSVPKKLKTTHPGSKDEESDYRIFAEVSQSREEFASNPKKNKFNEKRVKILKENAGFLKQECKNVAYWMSRDQRIQDNWALLYAQKLAEDNRIPLHIVFCLVPQFLGATIRHYDFMLQGLKEVEKESRNLNIQFHLLMGEAQNVLPEFAKTFDIGCLVADMSPLRTHVKWVEDLQKSLPGKMCFYQVDAHNVVPLWETSDKQEYAARTIRSKINKKVDEFLTEFPPVMKHPHGKVGDKRTNWEEVHKSLKVDMTVAPVETFTPGTKAGLKNLEDFVKKRLNAYADKRNDPNVKALSNVSPWLHFGQVSPQRAILFVKKNGKGPGVAGFVEECLVRRELSDNFCFYQKNYDNIKGAFDWARKTLEDHKKDKRPYSYSLKELEESKTHDDLWNAAQIQMVKEGKMHGFLRMYWAKKILEWTESPEKALEISLYLNDRYNLDGRDPNGYVGCMWSICGIHDQGWAERAVFGKIRYMNYDGCKRKFNVASFVAKYGAVGHLAKGSNKEKIDKYVKKSSK